MLPSSGYTILESKNYFRVCYTIFGSILFNILTRWQKRNAIESDYEGRMFHSNHSMNIQKNIEYSFKKSDYSFGKSEYSFELFNEYSN